MKAKILLLLLTTGVIACNNSDKPADDTTAADTTVVAIDANATPPPAPEAAVAQGDLNGSLAGMYVQSFAGANSHIYELKFENGKYSGKYEEYQDGNHTEVALENIIVDEGNKTIFFKKGSDQVNAKITDAGLEAAGETYEKR